MLKEKGIMESSVVEISTPAREREKESNEGNEGQKHALAEYLFFAHAARNFFVHADFSQICHRISLQLLADLFTNVSSSV